MDNSIQTHLNMIENIKDKITDKEYKELIENLGEMFKIKKIETNPKMYKLTCAYPVFYKSNICFNYIDDINYNDECLLLYGKVSCDIEKITIYVDFQKIVKDGLEKLFLEYNLKNKKFILDDVFKKYINTIKNDINITCILQEIQDFENDIITKTETGEFTISINELIILDYEAIY